MLKLRSKRKSVSQLTIENEPLLSTNYEANFEEVTNIIIILL